VYAVDPLTVLLRNGTTVKSAEYKIDKMFQVVEMSIDGKKQSWSFSDIASIKNVKGEDVTYSMIKRNPVEFVPTPPPAPPQVKDTVPITAVVPDTSTAAVAPPTIDTTVHPSNPADTTAPAPIAVDTALQTTAPVADTAVARIAPAPQTTSAPPQTVQPVTPASKGTWVNAQSDWYKKKQRAPWSVIFRGGPSYTFPMGSYYEGISGGIGFDLSVMIPVARSVGIGLSGSFAKLSVNEADVRTHVPSMYTQLISNDISLSSTTICATVHYFGPWKDNQGYWDVITGLGATVHSSSGYALYADPFSEEGWAVGFEGKTKFCIPFGIGLSRMVTKSFGIEGQTMFNMLFIGSAQSTSGYGSAIQYAYLWGFRVGVTLAVPSGKE
jgi:hypothetical protein